MFASFKSSTSFFFQSRRKSTRRVRFRNYVTLVAQRQREIRSLQFLFVSFGRSQPVSFNFIQNFSSRYSTRNARRAPLTERRNNIGLPTPPLLTPHWQPWQFLHPLQPPQRASRGASVPFFSWPRAVKGKQSLAENSASNNLSAAGPSCKESRPPLSLSITPPLTLRSFAGPLQTNLQTSDLPWMEREFLAQEISRARADFRAILTEIFSRQTQGKKFSDERSGVKQKKERESSEIFFFNSFESRKCEF